ncbi:MAG: Fis family transcriptional regulator [Candidatus Schekmanbacteria bacterium RBG_13_48_7]|uniref:Fis family transcriptional regulator n=1 Tax=Candidatus Schekmanbacteria bacterium RBG_13_48_7 TaxID=1817878 RepID=A0A1F7S235_9BACT|nr:MAG: Fis family transcriptional regulator [Candidatus Schekmanbacteria bacterium RBG_13_48_7]
MNKIKNEHTEVILNSIADGVFTVDSNWRVTSFNRAAETITGIPGKEALGKLCREVFRADICETGCILRKTMESGNPIVNQFINIVRADGKKIPISVSTALLKNPDGKVIGAVETFRDLTLVEELRKEITKQHRFEDIISRNHKMQKIFSIIPQLAESDSTVLLEGSSGTGKELFAKAIHNVSHRRNKPFIIVNCGALPDTLLESELFGHKAGAFTDAKWDKPGRFTIAEGGTIFLDEIGDVSPALQVRLLRVLQDKKYEPLGSNQTLKADIRIITATNKQLDSEVTAGRFREDLYYRINVIKITLPDLKERKEDIPLLVEHFIIHFNRLKNKEITGVSDTVMKSFMRHDWPGNIRQLLNCIEHAYILCPRGIIDIRHLPEEFQIKGAASDSINNLSLRELEKKVIIDALNRNEWKKMTTAKELGIDKNTLRRKILRFNIQKPD